MKSVNMKISIRKAAYCDFSTSFSINKSAFDSSFLPEKRRSGPDKQKNNVLFMSLLLSFKYNEWRRCEPIYIIKRIKYIDDNNILKMVFKKLYCINKEEPESNPLLSGVRVAHFVSLSNMICLHMYNFGTVPLPIIVPYPNPASAIILR